MNYIIKKTICLCLSVIIILNFGIVKGNANEAIVNALSVEDFVAKNNETKTTGNTIGNLAANGLVCEYKGWIYYSVFSKGTIYKVKKDGTAKQKVIKVEGALEFFSINIYKDYIYCIINMNYGTDGEDYRLCKIKIDGSEYKELDIASFVMLNEGKLYYTKCKFINDEYVKYNEPIGIYSMDLDGKNKKQIIKDKKIVKVLCSNNKLFYSNSDINFYSSNLDGKNKKLLLKDFNHISMDKNFIYYNLGRSSKNSNHIYKMKHNGQDNEIIVKSAYLLNSKEGYLYYTQLNGKNYDSGITVKEFNVKTKKVQKLFSSEGISYFFHCNGVFIYGESYTNPNNNNRINIKTKSKKVKTLDYYFVP